MKQFLFFLLLLIPLAAAAQHRSEQSSGIGDPRGEPELVVCSQNLENYGTPSATAARAGLTGEEYEEKQLALVARFAKAKCDAIGVQEVVSRTQVEGRKVLARLAKALKELTNRTFEVEAAPGDDTPIRNGFLIAKDRAEILNALSYSKVELPKLTEAEKPRFFSRGPFEIQLSVKPRGEGKPKTVSLINIHFKSRTNAQADPTGLEWETLRMQMAEALRRIIQSRHGDSLAKGEHILLVLGDRNSNYDIASAKILDGSLRLSNFQGETACRLSKRGVPLCKAGVKSSQILFSVLRDDPQTKGVPGTFTYKKVFSWLDDILMPAESLPAAWAEYDKEGDYDVGVVYQPKEASDHALVWVKLNF